MNRSVIIVAGGKGIRMGGSIPKQFLPVGGRPILMRTIEAFRQADSSIRIVLVLPADQQNYWKSLCTQYSFDAEYEIADGGETRFLSVKNGLDKLPLKGLIGVHDGVRPFVSSDIVLRCFAEAEKKKAVIPVVDVVESVRKLSDDGSIAVCRDKYKLVQTPQVFDAALLHRAYAQPYRTDYTDDASVVESMGGKIFLIPGDRENIKITTPFDMMIANTLLKCRS